ncbi:MAG: type II toxin-antitoxin system RelE/ParE family toxin [Bacteroidia bacterium]|nr:type II toxin-antitoxin system RelE/ParE family toxin [Bacteroidia bacterium]
MVEQIEWTDLAKNQLKNIYDYYSYVASGRIAKKLINKIVERVDILMLNPYAGRIEDLLSDYTEEYRYLVVDKYKIIYWINGNVAVVSSVFDCRQNPKRMSEHLKITL